jgi:ribonuclease D
VLPDAAIIDAARANPANPRALMAVSVFGGPRQRRRVDRWFGAIEDARAVPESDLPPTTGGNPDGMPATSRWRDRDPAAAARLAATRTAVAEIAERHRVLAQNLLASDVVRRLSWTPPVPVSAATVGDRLAELGARPWQVELTAGPLADALSEG